MTGNLCYLADLYIMNEEIIKVLEKLEKQFQCYETQVYENIAYLRKHNHDIEAVALKYKADAYNKCLLDVFSEIDKLKNN